MKRIVYAAIIAGAVAWLALRLSPRPAPPCEPTPRDWQELCSDLGADVAAAIEEQDLCTMPPRWVARCF